MGIISRRRYLLYSCFTLLFLYTIFQYHERGDTEASHQLCTGLLTKRTDELRNLQEALDKKQRLLSEAQRKLQKGESEALTLQRMVDQKSGKISNLQKMLYEKRDGEGGAMGDLEAVQESQQVVADGKLTKNYAHKLAIIVPFRDRFDELLVFAPWMHKFLPKQLTSENTAFEIFVINQADKYRFNRASLINVGYWAAKNASCDYMVMHDVDLLPNNPNLKYTYPQGGLDVWHLASPEYHPMYNYKKYVGGVLMMAVTTFEAMNGMSNKYWGWGREDDEFYVRMDRAKASLKRPTGLTTGKDTFVHIHDKEHRKRDYTRTKEQKEDQWVADNEGSFKNVKYTVQKHYKMSIDNSEVNVVDVNLHCDQAKTPWCWLGKK